MKLSWNKQVLTFGAQKKGNRLNWYILSSWGWLEE